MLTLMQRMVTQHILCTCLLFPLFLSFLPPANKVWGKVIFLHLSFCSQWGVPHCMLGYTPQTRGRYPPQEQIPPQADPSRSRPPPQRDTGKKRAVRTLLECILVENVNTDVVANSKWAFKRWRVISVYGIYADVVTKRESCMHGWLGCHAIPGAKLLFAVSIWVVTKFACPGCTFVQGTGYVDKALCA